MQSSDTPLTFPDPFAWDAAGGFVTDIPATTATPGLASLELGFPPLTFDPVASGGIPPSGADMNGILRQLSAWSQWQEAGGPVFFDGTFSTAIGGYPKWALLASTTLGGLWMSKVENNTADPDSAPTNWFAIGNGRLIDCQVFNTPGTFTYTPAFGVKKLRIRICGGAGAGGGTPITNGTQAAIGGGGGAGASGEILLAQDGAGQTITVGAAGVGASGLVGGTGGASSFGTFLACPGGGGGTAGIAAAPPTNGGGGTGGTVATTSGSGVTAILLTGGTAGTLGVALNLFVGFSGVGGSCGDFGSGGVGTALGVGSVGTGAGGGGGGSIAYASTAAQAGPNGRPGKVIVEGYS